MWAFFHFHLAKVYSSPLNHWAAHIIAGAKCSPKFQCVGLRISYAQNVGHLKWSWSTLFGKQRKWTWKNSKNNERTQSKWMHSICSIINRTQLIRMGCATVIKALFVGRCLLADFLFRPNLICNQMDTTTTKNTIMTNAECNEFFGRFFAPSLSTAFDASVWQRTGYFSPFSSGTAMHIRQAVVFVGVERKIGRHTANQILSTIITHSSDQFRSHISLAALLKIACINWTLVVAAKNEVKRNQMRELGDISQVYRNDSERAPAHRFVVSRICGWAI